MKTKIFLTFIMMLSFPLSVFAINAPSFDPLPATVNTEIYTFRFKTTEGAKVTVVGGPSDIQPVTDGSGNALDGIVEVTVGLAKDAENVFSVTAELNGQISESVTITLNHSSSAGPTKGDKIPPLAPVLDPYSETALSTSFVLTGSSEAEANIYVETPEGKKAASTQANSNGLFRVTVPLVKGETNRFNVSAEDAAYNRGPGVQVVVRVPSEAKTKEDDTVKMTTSEEEEMSFKDLEGHWAKEYVQVLYEQGVVKGRTETQFDPNGKITRAELTKIAMKAFNYQIPEKVEKNPFLDVPKDSWFAPYVKAAKEEGVVQGYTDGFHPNDYVNRAAALKILLEAAHLRGEVNTTTFTDVPKDSWFATYVAYAVNQGIVNGYSDATFRPGNAITRGEVSKMVVKVQELLEK